MSIGTAGQFLVHGLDVGVAVDGQGRPVEHLAIEAVAGAELHHGQPVEDVQLGDAETGDAAVQYGAAHADGVEPAAAPGPAGGRAELDADLREVGAGLVEQLRREGAAADAGGVGLDHAKHVVEGRRAQPGAGGGGPGGRVRRRNVRVRAVINIEQCALGALEEEVGAGTAQVVEVRGRVGDHRSSRKLWNASTSSRRATKRPSSSRSARRSERRAALSS